MDKDIIRFEAKLNNPAKINNLVTRYKCYICSPNEIANGYIFPQSTLDKMKNSVLGTAVVAAFIGDEKDGSRFGSHEDDLTVNEQGITVRSPMPIGVGFADPYVQPWMETYKKKDFLTCYIYLWTARYPGLETIPNRTIYQSMEVCTDDENKDGYKLVKDATVLGLCLLEGGDGGVDPAFKDATIVQFSDNNIKNDIKLMKKEFYSMINKIPDKYKNLSFKIPIKLKENAKKGLELCDQYKRGNTFAGQTTANYLINNDIALPEKIRYIAKYFSLNKENNVDEDMQDSKVVSNRFITYQLWGGTEGCKWFTELVDKMNEIDKGGGKNKTNISDEDFKKDELGRGDYFIKINKSKEALSNTSWGDVDKTSLLHKVLEAKNVKTVVDDIYALVEAGWENAPSQHLKYPIMEVKSNNEAVYNKGALKSALGYAKAQNKISVVTKVSKIYKKLGLDKDNAKDFNFTDEEYNDLFNKEVNMSKGKVLSKFGFTNSQIREILRNALSVYTYNSGSYTEQKYYVFDYDDTYVYVEDQECGYKKYRMTYTINDKVGNVDINSAEQIIDNGYTTVKEEVNMSKNFGKKKKKEVLNQMNDKLKDCKYTKEDKELCKYEAIDYDDSNIYALDKENCKMSAIPYSVKDEEVCPDVANCKNAKLKCGVFDEGEDFEDSDVMMRLNKKFTTDENIEGLANIARSKEETESDKKKIREMSDKIKRMEEDYSKLKSSYDEMSKSKKDLEDRNKDLQAKMAKSEDDKKNIVVKNTMSEISGIVPEKDMEELKCSVNKFSNIDNWVEHVQAFAFKYAKENPSKIPLNVFGKKEDPNDIWSKDIPEENKIQDK